MTYCDVIECKHNMEYGENQICGNAWLRVQFDAGYGGPICMSCEYRTPEDEDESDDEH